MKAHLRNTKAEQLQTAQAIRDMAVMAALREMGFGEKRLREFWENLQDMYQWCDGYSAATDFGSHQYTNLRTCVVKLIQKLDDVPWQDIMGIEGIVMNGVDVVDFARRCR